MDPIFHRHLIMAYVATWVLQLGYLAYVVSKWRSVRKSGRE